MPKMKLGAAVYAFFAVGAATSAVLVLRNYGPYDDVHGWPLIITALVDALTGVLFGIGAVTRRGLAADDGPWICQKGWLIVAALTAVGFLASVVSGWDTSPLATGPAVFVPHWIKHLQMKYYEGVAEAEVSSRVPDEVRPPTV